MTPVLSGKKLEKLKSDLDVLKEKTFNNKMRNQKLGD